jgi:hypothetical protein
VHAAATLFSSLSIQSLRPIHQRTRHGHNNNNNNNRSRRRTRRRKSIVHFDPYSYRQTSTAVVEQSGLQAGRQAGRQAAAATAAWSCRPRQHPPNNQHRRVSSQRRDCRFVQWTRQRQLYRHWSRRTTVGPR